VIVAPTPARAGSGAWSTEAEHHLVELVQVCRQLVVVELDDERDAVP
jgi:hypothetical protein